MTTPEEFATAATRRYLQNIVFVDDEIYDRVTGKPSDVVVEDLPKFKSPFSAAPTPNTQKNEADEALEVIFHPRQLVDSFASAGIVCALYQPQRDFEAHSESLLFKLCERADVVILDWELFDGGGDNILPLIENLANQSQHAFPHHSRLCVIYTGTPDLIRVNGRIYDYLKDKGLDCDQDPSPTTLNSGAMKIVVLGKPQTVGRPEILKSLEIHEEKLPERIIKEFSAMHTGILPMYALNGLAAVRRNSKRILDKFHRDLDGVFLIHRALGLTEEEAFEQLPELLAEEMLAVLTESQPAEAELTKIIQEIANRLTFISPPVSGVSQEQGVELIKNFIVQGPSALGRKIKTKVIENIHNALDCTTSKADNRLAALFNLRTNYAETSPPQLSFGTIVRWKNEDEEINYAVCLMPLCDSVRLDCSQGATTTFPFWTLTKLENGVNGRGVVVPVGLNTYEELCMSGKAKHKLWLKNFTPSQNKVVEAVNEDNHWKFIANVKPNESAKTYEWVAQLKPAHAQRIAHEVGMSFSRVGVLEAEWLRLKAEKDD